MRSAGVIVDELRWRPWDIPKAMRSGGWAARAGEWRAVGRGGMGAIIHAAADDRGCGRCESVGAEERASTTMVAGGWQWSGAQSCGVWWQQREGGVVSSVICH